MPTVASDTDLLRLARENMQNLLANSVIHSPEDFEIANKEQAALYEDSNLLFQREPPASIVDNICRRTTSDFNNCDVEAAETKEPNSTCIVVDEYGNYVFDELANIHPKEHEDFETTLQPWFFNGYDHPEHIFGVHTISTLEKNNPFTPGQILSGSEVGPNGPDENDSQKKNCSDTKTK